MECPYCGSVESKVIDTRPANKSKAIRRRRECLSCSKRYTTYERCEFNTIMVIKKNDDREAFNRAKILNGMKASCQKRPISMSELETIADEIEVEINHLNQKEVPSSLIGELIMKKLKQLDKVAYIRFASVYRAFQEPEEYRTLLDSEKLSKDK